jgi:anthranilate phosphoribosyltransferase
VSVNAAAALVAYDAAIGADETATNLSERIGQSVPRAQAVLQSGAAWDLVERWVQLTNRLAPEPSIN